MKKILIISTALLILLQTTPKFLKNTSTDQKNRSICSTTLLNRKSILKGLIFRDLEKCCENFVGIYSSCQLKSSVDTCMSNFADFTNDFCGYLKNEFAKYFCARFLKSWQISLEEKIVENYEQKQKNCKNVQICTKVNGDISENEACLDFSGFPRKKNKNGFFFRIIFLENSKILLQSIDTLKCISNTSSEIFMKDCDSDHSDQVFEVENGVNGFFGEDFCLVNKGLCLLHSRDGGDVCLFGECDSGFSGSDWVFYDESGELIDIF